MLCGLAEFFAPQGENYIKYFHEGMYLTKNTFRSEIVRPGEAWV